MSLSESLIRIGLTSSEVAELLGNSRGNAIIDMSSGHDLRAVDDNGVVRAIMSAPSLLGEFGTDANFAAFNSSGVVEWYVDADTGKLVSNSASIGRFNFKYPVATTAPALTIASGVITITGSCHVVDTESGAASDNLDTISGGNQGDLLVISPMYDSRTVVLKDETGNLHLAGDCSLAGMYDTILLLAIQPGVSVQWTEVARSINAA
jgi:hypothetical protein